MAMRAIMKKISPINRLYGIQRISCCCTSAKDRGDLNNEAVVCGLENNGSKVGKRMFYEWCMKVQSLRREDIQQRWKIWVDVSNEVWEEKSEEEQQRELDLRWTYLRNLLHRHGVDTSHHKLLLSMKKIQPRLYEKPASNLVGGTFEFMIGSPDKGLVSINRLVLDRGQPYLPRQCVNGLLCIINMDGVFLIYNPITGETSPWIEIKRKPGKRNHIAFGYDPQSNEHKVIWVSGSNEYDSRESILERPKDQVVEVFTVGKNTWRRIDATPPISITYEDSVYVDGCLYWRFRETEDGDQLEQIMRFDIVTEKFSVIQIPGFVIDPKEYKWSQTVDLTEIDGRIAVLTQTSLWTFHEEADGDIKWAEEEIDIPCDWNGKPELSIEALMGTNLILMRTERSDSIFYFNRNTKKSIRFPISPNCSSWDWEKIIQV